MALTVLVLSILISTGSLAWGYAGTILDTFTRWIIVFGALWLFSQWRRWNWFSSLGLFLCLLFAILGLLLDFQIGWMFSSAIFALFAWDMTDLRQKLHFITPREDIKGIERRHIARISFLALGGLLFASMLILLWEKFTPQWGAALLFFVILLGLLQLPAWFRRPK